MNRSLNLSKEGDLKPHLFALQDTEITPKTTTLTHEKFSKNSSIYAIGAEIHE